MRSIVAFCALVLALLAGCAGASAAPVDLLIEHGRIVTVNARNEVIADGYIAVSNGAISEIGAWHPGVRGLAARRRMDATGAIIIPGLVNTHTHLAMTLFRGLSDDVALDTWLRQFIWPAEKQFVTPEFVRTASELAMTEMLLSGTTTFCDMYFFEDVVGETATRLGMRAVLGEGILDFPTPSCRTPQEALAYMERQFEKWRGSRLITIAVAPHSIYTCSPDVLRAAAELARKHGALLHIHLAETEKEVADCQARYKMTPTAFLESLGFFAGGKVLAAHSVYLTESDVSIYVKSGVAVAHCPHSNLKLGSGIAPVAQYARKGVRVGIGTDGAASNNSLNMFAEMKTACLLQKGIERSGAALSATQALRMATVDGAKALGLGDAVGSLERGKRADLVILNADQPHLAPGYNPVSTLVYSMKGDEATTVIVDGRVVVDGGKVVGVDMDDLLRRARALSRPIAATILPVP